MTSFSQSDLVKFDVIVFLYITICWALVVIGKTYGRPGDGFPLTGKTFTVTPAIVAIVFALSQFCYAALKDFGWFHGWAMPNIIFTLTIVVWYPILVWGWLRSKRFTADHVSVSPMRAEPRQRR